MRSLFDFEAIRALIESGFTLRFDAMHAVTGPYARAILDEALCAPAGSVVNATPLPEFGGSHPNPNTGYDTALVDPMQGAPSPQSDRQRVVEGRRVSVRLYIGGRL